MKKYILLGCFIFEGHNMDKGALLRAWGSSLLNIERYDYICVIFKSMFISNNTITEVELNDLN